MMNYVDPRELLAAGGGAASVGAPCCAAPVLKPVGDRALLVDFTATGERAAILERVLALDQAITRARVEGIVETIVAYASLLVCYDPLRLAPERLAALIGTWLGWRQTAPGRVRRWRIPVAYGGEHGPDLELVARHCGLTPAEVIAAHASAAYRVAMFGFLPGFAYLEGLPAGLAVPRRATPRARVGEGGIGIGGAQTAIGSIAGPSGWHQIGRTPVRTFSPDRQPVTFLDPGDEIEIVRIDAADFAVLGAAAAAGELVAERIA